jgi:hypothetical protein
VSDKRASGGLPSFVHPSFDGDSTNQLPQSDDSTKQLPQAADSTNPLPQADRTITTSASPGGSVDKTAEVEGADILSVGFHAAGGTQKIEPVVPARSTVPPPRSLRPPAAFDMPFLPPADADPFGPPSSPRGGPPAMRAPAESTVQVRMAAGIPAPGSTTKLLVALGVCGVVGALILGVFLMRTPKAADAPHEDLRAGPSGPATNAPFPPVAPAVEPTLPDAVTAPVAKPLPARPATVVKSAPARTSSDKIGVLRVPLSVTGVLVDGTPHKVIGGALYLACGTHKIKTPAHASRTIEVPCGRTVFL